MSNKEKGDDAALEKEEKGEEREKEQECSPDKGSKEEKEEMAAEEESKAPRAPRRPKSLQIKVTLLDDAVYECELEVRASLISTAADRDGFFTQCCFMYTCDSCLVLLWCLVRNMRKVRSYSQSCASTSTCWKKTTSVFPSGTRPLWRWDSFSLAQCNMWSHQLSSISLSDMDGPD